MDTHSPSKLAVFLCTLILALAPTAWSRIIYVDAGATGANDGSSWEHAYPFLWDALAVAQGGGEIRVAQGVYKPDRSAAHPNGTGDRNASFCLLDGVAIRGGFAGVGTADPNARDIARYKTILSGDLAGDDAPVSDPCDLFAEPTRAENSMAIVTAGPCSRSAVLDGFIISSGNAIAPERHPVEQTGAGLLLSHYGADCCPSIRNCTFRGNCAHYGGAAYVIGAAPEIIDCEFLENAAWEGGAMITSAWRDVWFGSACEFVVRGCLFAGNCACNAGGALHMGAGAPSEVEGNRFVGNSARIGGAVYSAVRQDVTNCVFAHNQAVETGGSVYFKGGKLGITSCTFFGNAAQAGTALACLEPLHKGLTPPSATVVNTILWDGGNEIAVAAHIRMDVTYSDIQGGWPGEGNIDADPLFAAPGYWDANGTPDDPSDDFWVDGDYHLKSQAGRWDPKSESWVVDDVTSPCIDTGDPNSPVGLEPFPNGGRINMGAYGGTPEASKSYFGEPICTRAFPGDINGDCRVDFKDLAILAGHWLEDHAEYSRVTTTCRFIGSRSSVYGTSRVSRSYQIEGEFRLTIDWGAGVAAFEEVNATFAGETGPANDLGTFFNMTQLVSTEVSATSIKLVSRKNIPRFPGADVELVVALHQGLVYLMGGFTVAAYDGTSYGLSAVAVPVEDPQSPQSLLRALAMTIAGDINGDRRVNFADLTRMAGQWKVRRLPGR